MPNVEFITIDNIDDFVGKMVHCQNGLWYYYPLKISKQNGKYYYTDRNGVMMEFTPEQRIGYTKLADSISVEELKVYCDECVHLEKRPTMAETTMGSGVYYQTGARFYCPKKDKRFPLNSTLVEVGFSYCFEGIRKD